MENQASFFWKQLQENIKHSYFSVSDDGKFNSWVIVCKGTLRKVVQWGKQVNFSRSQFSVVRCKVVLRTCINKWTGAPIQNRKHYTLSLFTATEFDPCMMKPCQNGGICISRGVRQSPYYSCVCDAKWTGQDCQTKGTVHD